MVSVKLQEVECGFPQGTGCIEKNPLRPLQILSQAPSIKEPVIDVAPDGGYGWVCVVCCFLINTFTWGVNSAYGVYLAYYLSENLYPGSTPLQYAFIGGLSISTSMIVGPLATFVLSKTSTQITMAFGVAIATGSLITASFANKIWHLFLTQGVGFGIGMGFLYTISTGTISQWFDKKRSVANGLTAAGSGTGGLIFSLAIRGMLSHISIAWTFRIVAACVFVVNTGCTLLIRDRNKQINPNKRWFDPGLLRRYQFQLLLSWSFFSILGYTIILFSLPDFATSRGMTKNQGSILNALLNLSMAFGRPMMGLASDYAGRLNVSGLTTVATAVSCFAIWVPATSFGASLLFAATGGAVCGTFWTAVAPLCVEVVGIKDLPSALSLVWMSVVIPATFAEPIALYLRRPDSSNPYLYSQLFAGLMFVVATVLMVILRSWKIKDNMKNNEAAVRQKALSPDSEFVSLSANRPQPPPPPHPTLPHPQATRAAVIMSKWKNAEIFRWRRYEVV